MFKNLSLYRLPSPWNISLETVEEQLKKAPFVHCAGTEVQRSGWVSPTGKPEAPFVHAVNRQWIITLCTEQRILPSSVINDELKERAAAIEEQQGYRLGRKAMRDLKTVIAEELMPRAFTRRRLVNVWIDPVNGWLGIDTPSIAKGEEVIEILRKSIDNLPLSTVKTQVSPSAAMSDWLAGGHAPEGFTIDRDCELKAPGDERATVRYVRHALDGEGVDSEIKAHIGRGKIPTRLALTWDDRLSFVLTDRFEIKRLSMLDIVKEEVEQTIESEDERFDADFVLMTGELSRFLPQLLASLGGEVAAEDK